VGLRKRVQACFEAGALATGATLSVEDLGSPFSQMESDYDVLAHYRSAAEAIGRNFDLDDQGVAKPPCSASRPTARSITSRSSRPPASPRVPIAPSLTGPSRWPTRRSALPRTRSCALDCRRADGARTRSLDRERRARNGVRTLDGPSPADHRLGARLPRRRSSSTGRKRLDLPFAGAMDFRRGPYCLSPHP